MDKIGYIQDSTRVFLRQNRAYCRCFHVREGSGKAFARKNKKQLMIRVDEAGHIKVDKNGCTVD